MWDDEQPVLPSDDEVQTFSHKRLLDGVSRLTKSQHIRKPTRTEPALVQDEFHLVKSKLASGTDGIVTLDDVIGTLNKSNKGSLLQIGKELKKAKWIKRVNKPLETPQEDRIKRAVAYSKVKDELSRWDAVVTRNRVAEHQVFPLDYEEIHVDLAVPKKPPERTVKSELMIEMEAIDAKIRALRDVDTKQEVVDEKKLQEKLTRAELMARRKELAFIRRKESQLSARARKQNKIKSKKYHKLMKHEKMKEQIKEFELLQKVNPEAALEKLEKIEFNRIKERAHLRHKNTGTWAKNLQVRAKYDKDVRKDLAEQLAISRELTQKQNAIESSESEAEVNVDNKNEINSDQNLFNPWLKGKREVETKPEIAEFYSSYRKYWLERNKNEKDLDDYKKDINGVGTTKQSAEVDGSLAEPDHEKKGIEKYKVPENIYNKGILSSDSSTEEESNKKNKKIQNGILKNNVLEESKNAKNKCKKKKRKISFEAKTGPSDWIVEDIPNDANESDYDVKKKKTKTKATKKNLNKEKLLKSLNIDDLFDRAEDVLKEKTTEKVLKLGEQLKQRKSLTHRTGRFVRKTNNENVDLSFKKTAKRPMLDEELTEVPEAMTRSDMDKLVAGGTSSKTTVEPLPLADSKIIQEKIIDGEEKINPDAFVEIKPKRLRASLPDMVNSMEVLEEADENFALNNKEHQMMIAEAFKDDDIVADFDRVRQEEKTKNESEVDLSMPGWGTWGGCGIAKENQTRRFILKFPKDVPRRDENKSNVYINENAVNADLKSHLVSELPFPFESVKDYEASVRAPIGRAFVPETAFRMLTRPAVVTKMGKVITPMNENELVKRPARPKHIIDARIAQLQKESKKK